MLLRPDGDTGAVLLRQSVRVSLYITQLLYVDVNHSCVPARIEGTGEGYHNGGSPADWPKENIPGDDRRLLTIWGRDVACGYCTGACCSNSYDEYRSFVQDDDTGWYQSFTASYAVALQPLPPNTGMSLVADVAGTTVADDAFWAVECQKIPSNTLFIVVDMGAARDFFKPSEGVTYCNMLQSNKLHRWSPNGIEWVDVTFYSNDNPGGGSATNWPLNNVDGDQRKYLSFWGHYSPTLTGGCCSTSTAVSETSSGLAGLSYAARGQSFTMSYVARFQPLPPNTGTSLVVDVAGTTLANNAFWAEECKTIPASTLFIVVDMGAVREPPSTSSVFLSLSRSLSPPQKKNLLSCMLTCLQMLCMLLARIT